MKPPTPVTRDYIRSVAAHLEVINSATQWSEVIAATQSISSLAKSLTDYARAHSKSLLEEIGTKAVQPGKLG